MEWLKVFVCLCLATQCVISINTHNLKEEGSKNENKKPSHSRRLLNATTKTDEILEQSPSETIRFKKPIILRQREGSTTLTEKNDYRITKENIKEPKSDKDLDDEENRFNPVLTFSESPPPNAEHHWGIISDEPPYRAHGQLSHSYESSVPLIESQPFINKPEIPPMQLNYPHPESLEVKYAEDSRSEEYPEHFDGYNTRYPDNETPGNHGHAIHTETTHDFGRFLSNDYKSRLEKQAEEMIKRKKAQNSTNPERPQSNGEQNRHEPPRLYRGYQQIENAAFFRLGNMKNPITYKFPDVLHKQNGERHIYPSEEYPNREKYLPRESPPPSSEREYYISKIPVSSTETYQPQFSYTSKRYPYSHTPPPDSPRHYYYSTEQYNPTYTTAEKRNPPPFPHALRQYSTSTERQPPSHHDSENKYPHSYTTEFNQPVDYLLSQYHSSEKKKPLSYTNYNQQDDHLPPVYHSGEMKSPISYSTNYNQPTDNLPPQYHSSEKKSPIPYSTNYNQPTDNLPPQYLSGRKKSQIPHSMNYNQPTDNLPPQYHSGGKKFPITYSTNYNQPTDNLPPQYHSGGKKSPITYSTNYNQPTDNLPPQYLSGRKKSPIPHSMNYNQPTDNLPPQYHSGGKKSPIPHSMNYNQPTDNLPPQYHSSGKKSPISSYSTNYNQPTENLPPQYHLSEKNSPVSYIPNHDQHNTLSPARESYDNSPREYTLTPVPYTINSPEHSMSPPNQPYTKNEEISQERDSYKDYKSLLDVYRSHGFHHLNIDEMEDFLPPRFAFGNPFYDKIPITDPISESVSSEDYASNLKSPQYTLNTNTKPQTQGNYQTPYESTKYSDEVYNQEQNHFQPELKQLPALNEEPHYHEHMPYDSNRSPGVSAENSETPEVSRPVIFNTQVESPKETFSLEEFPTKFHSPPKSTEEIKIKALRITDYNSDTFFGTPTQKSVDNSAGPEFSSHSVPLETPPHSIVRKNPYLSNSEENVEYTERPRIYREKISIIDTEENQSINSKPSKLRTSNIIDTSEDIIHSDSSFAHDSVDDQQRNYNLPKSEKSPAYNQQWYTKSTITPRSPTHAGKISNGQPKRGGAVKQSSRQNHEKSKTKVEKKQQQRSSRTRVVTKVRSKKHRKRSSHKRPRKHKPSKRSQGEDQLKAEGSTYHWGMEKHKGTDGFFQYANVPDAKSFEFGYRVGGPEQTHERHHHTKGIHSKIKVNWEDKNGDSGDHYWEFNHDSRETDSDEVKPKAYESRVDELKTKTDERDLDE